MISFLFNIYKNTLSILLRLLFGKGCRFTPTCSEYTVAAIEKYGIIKGTGMGARRVLKCHPYSKASYYDPVK